MWIKNIHDCRSPFSLFIHALFCTMSGNKIMFPISEGNLNFLLCSENLRRDLCWRHCKYKEWVSFFSRFTRFVCSALRFISHEPRKKDTHSLIESFLFSFWYCQTDISLFCCPETARCKFMLYCKQPFNCWKAAVFAVSWCHSDAILVSHGGYTMTLRRPRHIMFSS